jgi:hypothetical protein
MTTTSKTMLGEFSDGCDNSNDENVNCLVIVELRLGRISRRAPNAELNDQALTTAVGASIAEQTGAGNQG